MDYDERKMGRITDPEKMKEIFKSMAGGKVQTFPKGTPMTRTKGQG